MSWVKIDDSFDDHPKILKLSPFATTLHIRALCWCSRHLTDGRVPETALDRLTFGLTFEDVDGKALWPEAGASISDELCRAGLWEKVDGGWSIHDYLKYNPSRDQVVHERSRKSEAGRQGGIRSGKSRRSKCFNSTSSKTEARAWTPASEILNSPTPTPTPLKTPPSTPPRGEASAPADPPRTTKPRKATPDGDPEGFHEFWYAYPKKVGRGAARRAWARILPGPELRRAIADALEWQSRSRQWTRERGQFIPHPATWLNQERWADGPGDLGGVQPHTRSLVDEILEEERRQKGEQTAVGPGDGRTN